MENSSSTSLSNEVIALGGLFVIGLSTVAYTYFSQNWKQSPEKKKKKKNQGDSTSSNVDNTARKDNGDHSSSSVVRDYKIGNKFVSEKDDTQNLRGYKLTKDGKVTSYFHRELSEVDKAILGDNSPRPITSTSDAIPQSPPRLISTTSTSTSTATTVPGSPATASSSSSSSSSAASSASVWNAAGTWEERDETDWAKRKLRQLLDGTSINCSSSPEVKASVSNISIVQGEASITMVRGKKKYIYDFVVELDFKLEAGSSSSFSSSSSSSANRASGKIRIEDITGELSYEFKVTVNNEASLTPLIRGAISTYIKGSSSQGLQHALKGKLDMLLQEIKLHSA